MKATRVVIVLGTSTVVATVLPGIRQRLDAAPTVPGSIGLVQAPDAGSLFIAFVVAIAVIRLFTTLDRRARSRQNRASG